MTVLDDIIDGVRIDLAERESRVSLDDLIAGLDDVAPALDPMPGFEAPGMSVIAEVKRKSPSKGNLADIADPAALAAQYEIGGASAISVLTERRRFNGTLADLDTVRSRVRVPVLRKDFMVAPYQVYEARAHGADMILLIVAALDDWELIQLQALVRDLGMTALVETHTPDEVRRALDIGANLIGVNNRNLKTLEVDLAQFSRLVELIPSGVTRVAESGIQTLADVQAVHDAGADVVLVGEALVKHGRPADAVAQFRAVGRD